MKKALCTLLLLLIAVSIAEAKPVLGVVAGLDLASAKIDPDYGLETKIKAGAIVGAVAELTLNQNGTIAVRASLAYVQKGWKEEAQANTDWKFMVWADEIVVAPSVVLKFPSGKVMPFLQAGPEFGINWSARTREETEYQTYDDDFTDWSHTNIGLNFGGGVSWPAGRGEMFLDAVYNLGLVNMYTGYGSDEYSIKTNGIQFTLGYLFSRTTK